MHAVLETCARVWLGLTCLVPVWRCVTTADGQTERNQAISNDRVIGAEVVVIHHLAVKAGDAVLASRLEVAKSGEESPSTPASGRVDESAFTAQPGA